MMQCLQKTITSVEIWFKQKTFKCNNSIVKAKTDDFKIGGRDMSPIYYYKYKQVFSRILNLDTYMIDLTISFFGKNR